MHKHCSYISGGILKMLCIENYSLFFVLAHTITLRRSLRTIKLGLQLFFVQNETEMTDCKPQSTTLLYLCDGAFLLFPVLYTAHDTSFKRTIFSLECYLMSASKLWLVSKSLLSWEIFFFSNVLVHFMNSCIVSCRLSIWHHFVSYI